MNETDLTRRTFIAAASAGSLAALVSGGASAASGARSAGKLAVLGGEPVRKDKAWPSWPHIDDAVVESVTKTVKSGIWCRI